MIRNTLERYGFIHILIHWLMAITIISLLCVGYYMKSIPFNPTLYFFHKSFGVLILMLLVVRIVWKLINIAPKHDPKIPNFINMVGACTHFVLYILMIIMPASGMFYSLFKGYAISFFNIFKIAAFTPNLKVAHFFEEVHEISAVVIIVIISLHTIAAIIHHYFLKDNTLSKILPKFK